MTKRGGVFVGLILAATAAALGMAVAETIGDHTTCITISAIMGPPPLNEREVQAVGNYVETEIC